MGYWHKKLCSPKTWAKVQQFFLGGCYPLRPSIVPNFIEIGQTSLETEGGGHWASDKNFFVTDGQKRDYLSREWQRARGATKNLSTFLRLMKLVKSIMASSIPKSHETVHISYISMHGILWMCFKSSELGTPVELLLKVPANRTINYLQVDWGVIKRVRGANRGHTVFSSNSVHITLH